ncbi:hypothetical protein RA210_U90144 [Rubrivivax sp. A210]|nr:hypothetical protein RA210_U90144 [Rubrivivax sp. A210]
MVRRMLVLFCADGRPQGDCAAELTRSARPIVRPESRQAQRRTLHGHFGTTECKLSHA